MLERLSNFLAIDENIFHSLNIDASFLTEIQIQMLTFILLVQLKLVVIKSQQLWVHVHYIVQEFQVCIVNGRLGSDKNIGHVTCTAASVIDYIIASL